jgi:hypothetical protein
MKILLLLLLALALFLVRPFPVQHKNFCLQAISIELPYNPTWETRALTKEEEQEVASALSQSYRYLGSGSQCFSFVSKDDRYVIKCIKQKPFDPPPWMHRFPLPFLVQKKKEKRAAKRDRAFQSFKMSFDFLPQETGLLYVHLNRTTHLQRTLSFEDQEGNTHWLELDKLQFVVQRKAELASLTIDRCMKSKDVDHAKRAIDRILGLNHKLSRKGFYNRDPNFRSNCGFIADEAILIDVGRIARGKRESPKAMLKFRHYLCANHPELLGHFDQAVANIASLE